jgi:hypothetical protein
MSCATLTTASVSTVMSMGNESIPAAQSALTAAARLDDFTAPAVR